MGINNLIARFLADKATKEEWEQLDTWKKESQDNLNELLELKSIWNESMDLKDYEEFDQSDAWNKINLQLEDTPEVPIRKTNFLSLKWVGGIAAAIALTIFAWNSFSDHTPSGYTGHFAEQIELLSLEDGSDVTMNRHTTLNYAENFTDVRDIILDGEAYFEVARDEQHPFSIHTDHADVTVLGTTFNIHEEDDYTDVYVTSGKVKVVSKDSEVILTVNDMVRCQNGEIKKLNSPGPNYLSWKTNKLSFQDVPLHLAIEDINKHFGKQIVFSGTSKAMNQKINDVFVNQDFDSVLESIALITGISYATEGKKIVIQ